jgi:N utilization substance protein A
MLSLAIGKEGQNVRLAVKLTGWRIDIKSATDENRDKAEIEATRIAAEPAGVLAAIELQLPVIAPPVAVPADTRGKTIRFAEEILKPVIEPEGAAKDLKKKKKPGKETAEDGIKLKKQRRGGIDYFDQDEDEI